MTFLYLRAEDIRQINLEFCGAGAGIRDENGFLSAVERPQSTFVGRDLFPTIWDKAAAYLHGFATTQTLSDGNKRTGFLSATVFLEIHGYRWEGPGVDSAEEFLLSVAANDVPIGAVSVWLKQHTVLARVEDRIALSRCDGCGRELAPTSGGSYSCSGCRKTFLPDVPFA